jgi:hypothetical protein
MINRKYTYLFWLRFQPYICFSPPPQLTIDDTFGTRCLPSLLDRRCTWQIHTPAPTMLYRLLGIAGPRTLVHNKDARFRLSHSINFSAYMLCDFICIAEIYGGGKMSYVSIWFLLYYNRIYIYILKIVYFTQRPRSRDSAVGIATGYVLEYRGVGIRVPVESRPVLGLAEPPVYWAPAALSPGVKWPGLEADHSLRTSAEVKKTWICTSTPTYVFMA